MLTWEAVDSLPKDLTQTHVDDTYVTMLFNDEVHTYEQVRSPCNFLYIGLFLKPIIQIAIHVMKV